MDFLLACWCLDTSRFWVNYFFFCDPLDLQASNDSDLDNVTVKVRVVQHSEEEEVEPEEATIPQKPSGGTANQSTHEDEVSSDETQM